MMLSRYLELAEKDSGQVYISKERLLKLIEREKRDREWVEVEIRVYVN